MLLALVLLAQYTVGRKSPQTSWAILMLRWEDKLAVLCVKADKMFMWRIQQNVLLILNSVPVTFHISYRSQQKEQTDTQKQRIQLGWITGHLV